MDDSFQQTFLSSQLSAILSTLPPTNRTFRLYSLRKPCSTSTFPFKHILLPGQVSKLQNKIDEEIYI